MKKKWLSRTIDIILGIFIALVALLQVDLILTKQNNHGVPSIFGYSFMEVLTDSMDGSYADSFKAGEGIIIEKRDTSLIYPDDVITFYSPSLSERSGSEVVVSHRVMEVLIPPASEEENATIYLSSRTEYTFDSSRDELTWKSAISDEAISIEANQTFYVRMKEAPSPYITYTAPSYSSTDETIFYTCGDNLDAEWFVQTTGQSVSPTYRDRVEKKNVLGVVISHSSFLGSFLSLVQSTWFIPVCVIIPLLIMAAFSLIDYIKKTRKEAQEEERLIKEEMIASGVDLNDEAAVLLFTEKARYRLEIKQELEKEKQKEIKRQKKALKKGAEHE